MGAAVDGRGAGDAEPKASAQGLTLHHQTAQRARSNQSQRDGSNVSWPSEPTGHHRKGNGEPGRGDGGDGVRAGCVRRRCPSSSAGSSWGGHGRFRGGELYVVAELPMGNGDYIRYGAGLSPRTSCSSMMLAIVNRALRLSFWIENLKDYILEQRHIIE